MSDDAHRYNAGMLRRFGWLYHVFGFGIVLGRMRFEEHSAERIRRAAAAGPVVYVLDRRSTVDHLALNAALNRRRLPLSVWANGILSFFWQPVVEAWRELAARWRSWLEDGGPPDPVRSGWLARQIVAGHPVALFLDEQRSLADRLARRDPADPLHAVLDAHAQSERPIQIVPVVVIWNRSPSHAHSEVRDFLVGSVERPGIFSRFLEIYFGGADDAMVQVGEPVDLPDLVRRVEEGKRERALRLILQRYIRRESSVVRGPKLLPRQAIRRMVLNNPPMRELAREEAARTGRSVDVVLRRMGHDFDAMAADFRFGAIRFLRVALHPLWTRVFSGVDARPEDIDRIRTAMRDGTAILVPCHKSHFDYVLLSWMCYMHDLIVPHIIAGNNLAIWPVSLLARASGAIFIKRSFGDDRIFPAVFSRYLRELVRQGYPIEFFIEGGRTRSGRLLPPKLGVLGMILEGAVHRKADREVTLLPIFVGYEQVAEEGAYARELGGEAKRPEQLSDVVQARSVLDRRFGRAYLRVGEPVRCSSLVDADTHQDTWGERPADVRKAELRRIGERLVHRIGLATVVLPTGLCALALLSEPKRGMRHEELLARISRFRTHLQRRGATEATSLGRGDLAIAQAMDRFLRSQAVVAIEHDAKRLWSVVPEKRIVLDFYKNQLLHFFYPAGLAALALRTAPEGAPATLDGLMPAFEDLIRRTRRELVLDPDLSARELLAQGLGDLVAHGAATATEAGWQPGEPLLYAEILAMFDPLVEAERTVLRQAHRLKGRMDAKGYVKAILSDRSRLLGAGLVTRPESLTSINLQSAVETWIELGAFRKETDRLVPVPDAIAAAVARLAPGGS